MLTPEVEYIDDSYKVDRPPVRKLVWNGTEFVPLFLYRLEGYVKDEVHQWLVDTYGPQGQYVNGCYWDCFRGKFTVMDEKVYMFYKLKWAGI